MEESTAVLTRRVLTVAAASRRLNVAEATIYRACRRGQLEHVRIGRAIRIPEDRLDALLVPRGQERKQ